MQRQNLWPDEDGEAIEEDCGGTETIPDERRGHPNRNDGRLCSTTTEDRRGAYGLVGRKQGFRSDGGAETEDPSVERNGAIVRRGCNDTLCCFPGPILACEAQVRRLTLDQAKPAATGFPDLGSTSARKP